MNHRATQGDQTRVDMPTVVTLVCAAAWAIYFLLRVTTTAPDIPAVDTLMALAAAYWLAPKKAGGP